MNARGFSRASEETKKAGTQAGIVWDDDAPLALHWASPALYSPLPDKRNILYTVWESPELAPEVIEAFAHPLTHAILTPSTFCQHIFQLHTKKPVYTVPHGFDPAVFHGTKREWSPLAVMSATRHGLSPNGGSRPMLHPFICLYVGALNPRKGTDFIVDFWQAFVRGMLQQGRARELGIFQLIVKTNMRLDAEASQIMAEGLETGEFSLLAQEERGFVLRQNWRSRDAQSGQPIWRAGNLIIDTRAFTDAEMADLYRAAHLFLFPTRAEGFGLTALEAVATGLPIIATNYSGHLDFLDTETAYLTKWKLVLLPNTRGLMQTMAQPDARDFADKFSTVIANYRRAAIIGQRAAAHVHAHFTWEQVGKRLKEVLLNLTHMKRKKYP